MEEPARPFRLAALCVAAAFVTVYGAFIAQGVLQLAAPVLALAPLGYVLFMRAVVVKERLGPRAAAPTVVVAAVGGPVFGALAHLSLAMPIIKHRDGRDPAFIEASLILVAVIVVAVIGFGLAARAMLRRGPEAPPALLRIGAPAAVAVVGALVVSSALSGHPSPSQWMRSLPVVASPPAPGAEATETEIDGLTLRWSCTAKECNAWMRRRNDGPGPGFDPDVALTGRIVLRRDAAHDIWILDASGGRDGSFIDHGPDRAAFRGISRIEVRPRALLGSLSPPRGWIVTAALGAALGVWQLLRRRSVRRRLDEILAAEAGTLDEEGWITLDRGLAPVRTEAEIAPGPVLVVLPTAAGSAYRSEGARAVERVLAGTRAELVDEARRQLAALDARALAVVLVTAAPLAVAWAEGLR